MDKPSVLFDRDHEWAALTRFITDDQPGATLGVVFGRRRQGRTFLLDAACKAAGGFYFGATEAADAESPRRIAASLTAHLRPPSPSPFHFADWAEAVDVPLSLGRERRIPVVVDEFPYLAQGQANPGLPSILQEALRPLRGQRTASRTRILLCGSALSFMGGLLAGSAPLRGRAGLELLIRPLEFRLAAKFWNTTDPGLAEPDLRDTALDHSVLAAVAEGNATRGGIASFLGRKASFSGAGFNDKLPPGCRRGRRRPPHRPRRHCATAPAPTTPPTWRWPSTFPSRC